MSGIAEYFNLNKPVTLKRRVGKSSDTIKKTKANFTKAAGIKEDTPKGGSVPWWEQIIMYLGIAVGVFFSDLINQYNSGHAIVIKVTSGTIVLSLIVALVVIPYVYDRLKVNAQGPGIVRFGLFVQNGVFWNVLFNLGKKAIAG